MVSENASTAVSKLLKAAAACADEAVAYLDSHHKLNCAMAAKELAEAAVMLKNNDLDMPMKEDK